METHMIQKVKDALVDVLKLSSNADITMASKLKEDLGLDSMSSLTFLMTLEENIEGFVVDPDNLEMTDLDTVDSITHYIKKQLAENDGAQSGAFVESDQVVYA